MIDPSDWPSGRLPDHPAADPDRTPLAALTTAELGVTPRPEFAIALRERLTSAPLQRTDVLAIRAPDQRRTVVDHRRWLVAAIAAAAVMAVLLSGWTLGGDGHPAVASATAEGLTATVEATFVTEP